MEPLILAIAGGTASGKTTLARRLVDTLGADQCLLICHDRYYLDVEDPSRFNYDHPGSLETDLLVEHLRTLKGGSPAELPIYDYASHRRQSRSERVEPRPVVIVEGILVLEHEGLAASADLKVFVHAPADLRLERRIRRDVEERGRTRESVLEQWNDTVSPMHIAYVEPSRCKADLVLEGVGPLEPLVERMAQAVERAWRGLPVQPAS